MHVLQKNYLSFIVKNMKKNDIFYKKFSKIYDVYTKPHKYAVKFLIMMNLLKKITNNKTYIVISR